MSRFFRNLDSSSSSESSAGTSPSVSDDEENQTNSHVAPVSHTVEESSTSRDLVIDPVPSLAGSSPRDFLLHALLEERCLLQARSSLSARRFGPDSAEVLAEARENYVRMTAQLSNFNLVAAGLEHEQHSATRQRFREGMEILSQRENAKSRMPTTLRRLLAETEADSRNDFHGASRHPPHSGLNFFPSFDTIPTGAPFNGMASFGAHGMNRPDNYRSAVGFLNGSGFDKIFESRYKRDFEERTMLGRGGFGVVYHVKHRLDDRDYAVKKIPLSLSRIQKIQQRGQSELDEFLRELRTLARLEHPNIVRYYGGWIEWVDGPSSRQVGPSRQGPAVGTGGTFSTDFRPEPFDQSLSRIVTDSTSRSLGIVFEDSQSAPSDHSTGRSEKSSTTEGEQVQRVSTRNTVATVSDETIETIDRSEDISASIASAIGSPGFSGPTLALHVQMAMYPLTLAEFLDVKGPGSTNIACHPNLLGDTSRRVEHCFHLEPSVGILRALLDGIEYLHNEGIVHRDIKPANIFIGPSSRIGSATSGSIDHSSCGQCLNEGNASPLSFHVRIGDFGLVTELAQDPCSSVELAAIGTEIYQPPRGKALLNQNLDIYALGIIAFELLYKFDTRSERHHLIQQLKEGQFPIDFASGLSNEEAMRMKDCIATMLSREADASAVTKVRQKLRAMPG